MKTQVAIVNAFIDGDAGGNPAGVVVNADLFTQEQKLQIAKKVGLSETAFVSTSENADIRLEFFTPERQIAHCGHATVATFSYLVQQGIIKNIESSKETIDGIRKIFIDDGKAYMEQKSPVYTLIDLERRHFETLLGIESELVIGKPIIVNTGNRFLLVQVPNIDTLNKAAPEMSFLNELSEKHDLIGLYLFTLETNKPGRQASTRMFAPRYGIQEESATGMAAGPLACHLYDNLNVNLKDIFIEQGFSMSPISPSCIHVKLEIAQEEITALFAGGVGRVTDEIEVEID